MNLSIVIPVLNEAESLKQLYGELVEVASQHGYIIEILFVDDGSTDGSFGVIRSLAAEDARVRGLQLRRNFGKASALAAGFAAASHDVILTLDADLQDDPHEIPRMLAALEKVDLVTGWKQLRRDPGTKVYASKVFNWLANRLSGLRLHDHNCGFKAYRREVTSELRLYGDLHRFVPFLAAARGFKVDEVAVNHRPRTYGRSKYGPGRLLHGFNDLFSVWFVTRFGDRPQHLLGTSALVCMIIAWGCLLLGWWLSMWGCLILAVQLFVTGWIGELLRSKLPSARPTYSIAEQIGGSSAPSNASSATGS